MIYQFQNYEFDTIRYRLIKDGQTISVEPQVFNLLSYLIAHRDRLVSRQELFEQVWSGREVSDTTLSNHIKIARRIIGDDGQSQQKISTVHSRGYQFIVDVQELPEEYEIPLAKGKRPHIKFILPAVILLFSIFLLQWFQQPESDQPVQRIQQVAVLPFSNNKPHPSTDYFGFAIADQVIGDLIYLNRISVRSSASVRQYDKQVIDPQIVGKKLQADYVVIGNYLKEDTIIKLNVELIQVETKELIWRESITVKFENIFQLQEIVAKKVAKALNLKFTPNALQSIAQDISTNPLAYEYYLKSISYPFSTEGHRLAIEMLTKSIQLDEQFAPAIAFLGYHQRLLEQHGLVDLNEENAVENSYLRALSINPDSLSALGYLSSFYTESNRMEEALHLIHKMFQINKNSAQAHFSLGYIYRYAGLLEESVLEMKKALQIEPGNKLYRSIVTSYFVMGDYDNAQSYLWLDKDPIFSSGWKGLIYFRKGNNKDASYYFKKVAEKVPEELFGLVAALHLAYLEGDLIKGLALIKKTEPQNVIDGENIYHTASYYCLYGERERCFTFFEMAIDTGYFNYPFMATNQYFNTFKSDVEYQRILERARQKHLGFKNKYL